MNNHNYEISKTSKEIVVPMLYNLSLEISSAGAKASSLLQELSIITIRSVLDMLRAKISKN